MNAPARMRFVDFDARREPKTDHYCCRCQKDLKPGEAYRTVHLVNGGAYALHPEDEAAYVPDGGDMGWFSIGNDCARQLGVEWTHPPTNLAADVAADIAKTGQP